MTRTRFLLLAGVLAVLALALLPASSIADCTPPYCPSPPAPPPPEGLVKVPPKAIVKRGKIPLALTCSGGPCKGTVKLTAKIKTCKKGQKGKKCKKRKKVVIATAPFKLAAGASKTVKVKLSRAARRELKKRKKLKATATGPGVVSSTVKLKLAEKKHHRHR